MSLLWDSRPAQSLFFHRRTAKLVLASVAVCAGLIFAGSAAGRIVGHLHPALVPLQTCESACWWSIIPGETSLSAARAALDMLGYNSQLDSESQSLRFVDPASGCAVEIAYNFARVVYAVDLRGCANLALGDLLTLWGAPVYDGVYLAFGSGHSQAILYQAGSGSPRAPVYRLHLTALYDVNTVTIEDLHL